MIQLTFVNERNTQNRWQDTSWWDKMVENARRTKSLLTLGDGDALDF